VVDAGTGFPSADVDVVAYWQVSYVPALLAMRWEHADIYLTEAVTDADGQFRIPAWGPVNLPDGCPCRRI
jgi:hypothetical protein